MILGEWIWCAISEEMSFEVFTPVWSHVNDNEKKNRKKKSIFKILKKGKERKNTRNTIFSQWLGLSIISSPLVEHHAQLSRGEFDHPILPSRC